MTSPPPDSDLDALAAEFPSWQIGTVWQSVPSGPDARNVTAYRDGILLAAADAPSLAEKIRHEGG